MPIFTAGWGTSTRPQPLTSTTLGRGARLGSAIVAELVFLTPVRMRFGRQLETAVNGRMDLFSIAPDASLVALRAEPRPERREAAAQAGAITCLPPGGEHCNGQPTNARTKDQSMERQCCRISTGTRKTLNR